MWKVFHRGKSVFWRVRHRAELWLIWVLFSSLLWVCGVTASIQFGHRCELLSPRASLSSAPRAGAHSHSSSLTWSLRHWDSSHFGCYWISIVPSTGKSPFWEVLDSHKTISGDRKQMDTQVQEDTGKQWRQLWPACWWASQHTNHQTAVKWVLVSFNILALKGRGTAELHGRVDVLAPLLESIRWGHTHAGTVVVFL